MKLLLAARARRDYDGLSPKIRASADKQFDLLIKSIRHPSIHAKKYDEKRGVWQGRVDRQYRFYFLIQGDMFAVITIQKHPK